MAVIIAGFSPNDKVPGFYGQVQYGTAGQSGAGLPIALLLVGLASSAGTITADTQIQQVYQPSDLDTFAGIGSELACMGYDALLDQSNIPIFIAAPKAAGGAVAANAQITPTGSPTSSGTYGIRIGGYLVTTQVNVGDTVANICTNIASNINGANVGRLPITAVATATYVTLTCATPGVRGNQHIVFQVTSLGLPGGVSFTLTGVTWATGVVKALGTYGVPTVANGFYYKVTAVSGTGTTGASEPTWPTTVGTPVVDNSGANQVTWTCWGQIVNGGGITLGGGSGLETYTNLLNTLTSQGYGRIAVACNDATSLSAWKANVDSDAGAMVGYLQHVVFAMNTTIAATTTIAQGVNDQRFQCVYMQSCETHPSRMAAVMAADRAFEEVSDPNKNYDGYYMNTIAPQSQPLDVPLHSQQVTMLNVGITPLWTVNQQALVVRGITTKSLTNNQPDYSTLDIGFAVVPDFVLTNLRFAWTTFQANNSRVRGPLASGEKIPPTGVAYPALWNSVVQARLLDMENGNIPGTCAPIIFGVEALPPTTNLDPTAVGRLMSAVPVNVMADLHQVGISVQQI